MIEYASVIPVPHIDNLELRLIEPDDAPKLYDFVRENQDHLRSFQPQVAGLGESLEQAVSAVERSVAALATGTFLQYRVMEDGEMAGTVTLFDHEQRLTKAGYYIGKNFVGRRFAPRATRALLDYAACPEVWDLDQAELHIADENVPSQHVAQSLGARPTSYFGSEYTGTGDFWHTLRIWKLAL